MGFIAILVVAFAFAFAALAPKWIENHPDIPEIPPGESRPVRTFSKQLLWLLLVSTTLPALIGCAIVDRRDLIDGTTWTPGVVYGLGSEVYRARTPQLYWMVETAYLAGMITMFVTSIIQVFDVAAEEKR